MKNIIITSSDEKYGKFLINHWLKSLKENVDLSNVDVLVLDYGLTKKQRLAILKQKVPIKKCKRDGHVVTIRYRDIYNFLSSHKYDQVLLIDSGDLIFQADISKMFSENKEFLRGFCEKITFLNLNTMYPKGFFSSDTKKKMAALLKDKQVINGGVIIGPQEKIRKLSKEVYSIVKNKKIFGPDQAAINYVLYREGFKKLRPDYNMVLTFSGVKFKVKKGKFYFENGKLIPVVHNAGGSGFFRPISKFGYGPKFNKRKKAIYHVMGGLAKTKTKILKN